MKIAKRAGIATALLLAGTALVVALATGDSTDSGATAVSPASPLVGEAGMRVYRDAETGAITSQPDVQTVAELGEDLQNALRHDDEGLTIIRHADGSESADLQGRYQSASVVHLDENGKATFCTDNAHSVERAMNGEVTAPVTREVK